MGATQIEIGIGLLITALGILGFISSVPAGVVLLTVGVVLSGHGVLNMRGIKLRSPFYRPRDSSVAEHGAQGSLPFFRDRTGMLALRGGLDNELRRVSEAWVAFESGSHFIRVNEQDARRIRRMILLAPDSALTSQLSEIFADEFDYRDAISRALNKAAKLEVPVKLSHLPILNVVIGDPHQDNAWARIQVELPYLRGADWPNILVTKAEEPQMFDRILRSYEEMWTRSALPGPTTRQFSAI